ncbi:MAG: DEAD/DEAH box helicase [Microbacterium sp.]
MPKSKKPAGGRPARNFDPKYARKSSTERFRRPERPGQSEQDGRRGDARDGYARRDDRGYAPRADRRDGYRGGERRDDAGRGRGFTSRDDRRDDQRGFRSDDRRRENQRGDRDGERRGERFGSRDDRGNASRDDRRDFRSSDRRDDVRGGYRAGDRRDDHRTDRREVQYGRRDDRGYAPRDDRRDGFRSDDRRRDDVRGFRGGDRREDRGGFRRDERPVRRTAKGDHVDVVHEKLAAETIAAGAVSESFGELGLGDNITRALAALGAEKPFPIQAATIPTIIDGRNVLARGRTGSGKTIAFGAPLVERVLRSKANTTREFGRAPVALVLAPTRELALQIDRTVQPIARSVGLFTTQIYGGVPQARQVGALKKGVDIIIGTPGRIEDLHEQGKLDLSQIAVAVIDEADHMCELGFLEPVQRILRLTRSDGQKLLFSATLDREVASLVDEFLTDPAVYEVAGETQETGTIDHRVLVIDHREKPEILEQLVSREGKTLVFSRTRAFAEQLAEQFDDAGISAAALHGDLNQAKRTRNIERFAKGRVQVLVATDVAARGIHVDDVDLVVQADAATEYKTYLHRSGRTGRAGRAGRVVTLITRPRQQRMAELLERADIDAPFERAHAGDELLDELAGTAPSAADLTA